MDQQYLMLAIKKYKQITSENNCEQENLLQREERIKYYQAIDKEKLLMMSEDDFVIYIGTLWASNMYGSKQVLVNKMIEGNSGFTNLKQMLVKFLYGMESIEKRWDEFYGNAKYFGLASMSELLGYIYPNQFALCNSQVTKALELLGCQGIPHYNQFTGKSYLDVCETVKYIGAMLQQNGVKCENLLAVDYFLWEVADLSNNSTNERKITAKTQQSSNNSFVHKDTIEKIVNIGTLLGFDAKSEVKVANGAIVDAVWSVDIGNMGRVMYVFEVQTHGNIDSLILNLQKASKNKAVQAIVAVSDEKQLECIKREVEPLFMDIKLWDYVSVMEVYEHLSAAFDSINKLELVPQDWKK